MPGAGAGGKRQKKQPPKKGKGRRVSGNPAKAAQEKAAADKAAKEKAASANPFGTPGGAETDYEQAAAALDLPQDFAKFLK